MTRILTFSIAAVLLAGAAEGAWRPIQPRAPKEGEIAVAAAGNCDRPGATYILTKDIASPRSAIFIGSDATLDLNGHAVTYAAGYAGVPNAGFEDGLSGWDVSKAPGARVEEMPLIHPICGRKVCVLPEGEEIVSRYVDLPVAGRAYYAMAAVAHHQMRVGIFVEDERGRSVECAFRWGGNVRPCCPEPARSPKLGGGVVFALIFGQPAGRYRIRVASVARACVIDEVDIRPAMDVGIGIVDGTMPWAYYKCILDGDGCAFFDYTKPGSPGEPVDSIPRARGPGTVVIRNGTIRLGSRAIRTWGIQSTAEGVKLVIENVRFEASGINTYAVSAPSATIRDCRAEIDAPWIIDRHRQQDYAVSLMGRGPSEVSGCELLGGQGQISVAGDGSRIEDNLLVNRQNVVNHYSIGAGGRGTRILRNRILPEQGAGILIGRVQGLEILENEIRVEASPPVNEYHDSDYSVSAIRLTDYNAKRDDPKGYCGGNRIQRNRISVTGRSFEGTHPGYRPMAYGIFMSVGGDQNFIEENEFVVEQKDPPNDEKHGAYAFYIGGSSHGGVYAGNRITSNVTPVWIGTMYGPGENVVIRGNTFRRAEGAAPFVPFLLGWYKYPTRGVGFYSNRFDGVAFGATINDYTSNYTSEYEVGWTLTVRTAPEAEVTIRDAEGREVLRRTADEKGVLVAPLAEYRAAGRGQVIEGGRRVVKVERVDVSSYTVEANGKERTVSLTADMEIGL
ncbi:MAG: hypothetical protein JXP34_13530 [Planctomycetes bacterium]|nr:hypothetical protein [Planctomycetota bacterium]